MRYSIHENGWTVMLEDFDFNTATQDDINQIAKMLSVHTVVVARDQNLTVDKEVEVLNMFKDPEPVFNKDDEYFNHTRVDENGIICRVTAELNEHGKPGLGANPGDFDWHANFQWRKNRKPIIWLRSIKGSEGSRTSYNNNVLSYNDLPENYKSMLKNFRQKVSGGTRHDGSKPSSWSNEEVYYPPVVYTNQAGVTGLYFPFKNVEGWVDPNGLIALTDKGVGKEIKDMLIEHTTQEKYIYHHDWKDGDVVIADQWLGLHKRWFYKSLEKRLLHRAAIGYPDQDYTQ